MKFSLRSLRSLYIKGTEESLPRVDSSVSLMHHNPGYLEFISLLSKETQNPYFDFRIQSWNFLKKRILKSPSKINDNKVKKGFNFSIRSKTSRFVQKWKQIKGENRINQDRKTPTCVWCTYKIKRWKNQIVSQQHSQ